MNKDLYEIVAFNPEQIQISTNGQLAYVYAVNKMTDGAMKLRAMGISEEQVEEMKAALPVRIVKLVDAIQGRNTS